MASVPSSPITSRAPQVEFTNRFVQPPSNLYVFRDDQLFLRSQTPFASTVLFLRARLLTPKGDIITLEFNHVTSTTAFEPTLTTHDIQEGFLVGLTVHSDPTLFSRGEVYAVVGITRGGADPPAVTQLLCADYIEGLKGPSWPQGGIRSSVEGPGNIAGVLQSDPAAGDEFGITINDRTRSRLISGFFTLTTDATALTRRFTLELLSGGGVVVEAVANDTQPASSTRFYLVGHWGTAPAAIEDRILVNWPQDVIMSGLDTLRTNTFRLQAGDDYSVIRLLSEQWLEE